jgi:hypothetical protein
MGLGATTRARADDLISFEISTAGRSMQAFNDDGSGARTAEVDIPESSADLRTGPVGRAFSSIVWPGPIVGNLGTLLRVLQPTLPPSVRALNDPVRAEATTGQDPPTTTLSLPDVSMTATASDQLVEARATVGTLSAEAGPTSGFSSFGSARLRSGMPNATASASVGGLSIAGGLVTIGAVTSTANASSDGTRGAGTASTDIAGLTVAGQRIAVDDRGLHLGSGGARLGSAVNRLVNETLVAAGIELSLGVPTRMVTGASATMVAPALTVTVKGSSGVLGLVLGGAQASVSGLADSSGPPQLSDQPAGPSAALSGSEAAVPSGPERPSFPSPPAPATRQVNPAPVKLDTATRIFDDRHRLRGGQVALALVAAGLVAAGLGELFLLTIGRDSGTCPNGGESP